MFDFFPFKKAVTYNPFNRSSYENYVFMKNMFNTCSHSGWIVVGAVVSTSDGRVYKIEIR